MTSILRRIVLIIKSWLHSLMASAEDPRQEFASAYRRQQELLGKVRQAQANVATSGNQLNARIADSQRSLAGLQGRARQALVDDQEKLARFAIQMRLGAETEMHALERQQGELAQEEQVLEMIEHRLTSQMQLFAARQEVLQARYSTAEAQVSVQEAMGGVSEELAGLGDALEKAEERTERMQARASAIDELVELGVLNLPGGSVDDTPALMPAGPADESLIEEQLVDLRQQIGTEPGDITPSEGR